jgi:hypothetical protein
MAELPQFKSFDVLEFYSQAKLHDLLNGLLFQDRRAESRKNRHTGNYALTMEEKQRFQMG